jgi:outer membrane protein TolC
MRALAIIAWLSFAAPAFSQSGEDAASVPLTLTLEEAIQIALIQGYEVRYSRLEIDNAAAQIREAWGQVLPQVDGTASYTRNIITANPFAGSEAGGLFQSFGFLDWLAYNESARLDEDPLTEPLTFDEYMERRRQGMARAGVDMSGDGNPFAVDNQFLAGISISQTLYSGAAFAAIRGARQLKEINQRGLDRQEQITVDQVRQAFYQALLATEQERVSRQSVQRTEATLADVRRRVEQGVAPVFQRLSAEVELANLETQLVQSTTMAEGALDVLKMELGIPVEQSLTLRGSLEAEDVGRFVRISSEDAVELAIRNRPDLEQARLAIQLREIDRSITRSAFLPTVSAFANLQYAGNVPDSRTLTVSDPNDPFAFTTTRRGFLASNYWDPSVNVGLRLNWNLFDGFQTSARVQQREVAVRRAEVEFEQAYQAVSAEVQASLRSLEAARRRIESQRANVSRAELNYRYASARLREGVATPLEEREASMQLDTSRLNYLQAVHDYLVAQSAFETAIGMPLEDGAASLFTAR